MTNGIRVTKSDFWKALASYPRKLVKYEPYCKPFLMAYVDVELNKPIGSIEEHDGNEVYELDINYYHKREVKR